VWGSGSSDGLGSLGGVPGTSVGSVVFNVYFIFILLG
jgi:hypothetical protein